MEQAFLDKEIYKVLTNPYGLNPMEKFEGDDVRDLNSIIYDEVSKSWIGPFVMAGINTKVVRRSNALSGYIYGKDFRYDEATISGKGLKGRIKGYLAALPLLIMTAKPESFLKKIAEALLKFETLEGKHIYEILKYGEIKSHITGSSLVKLKPEIKKEELKAADLVSDSTANALV